MTTSEEKLRNLLEGGFRIHFFDPDNDKSGIIRQVQTNKEPVEIDSIAIKENILILINIYDGNSLNEAKKKIRKFFRRSEYLNNVNQLNLKVEKPQSARGVINRDIINTLMEEISNSNFVFIIVKLFFCPNLYVPPETCQLQSDESIIDKKIFNYFDYALKNITYEHMERELLYFLKVKFRDIKLPKGSRRGVEPELTSEFPSIGVDLGNNQKMYSACASVNDIIQYVQVWRTANQYNLKAFQRMINGNRLKNISNNYLNTHKIFPNNIILAFNPDIHDPDKIDRFILNNGSKIKIYKEFGSLIIIDGQHRLLAHLLNPTRDINNTVLINVVLFLDKENAHKQMADLFYIINMQQKRLTPLVALQISSRLRPNEIDSIWYQVFNALNNLNQSDNYLYNKIVFEEKELKEDSNKISIVSIIKYSGINRITNGTKVRGHTYIGLKDLAESCTNYTIFYQKFIRKYFTIIGEILRETNTTITPRDLGGLLRLIIHFLNDRRTKDVFSQLSQERRSLPQELKDSIKEYLKKIPFSRLSEVDYAAQYWAAMEGFFLGCIRKNGYRGFGFSCLLTEKGKSALNRGKIF
jgi:DGQHR domain-containing protein